MGAWEEALGAKKPGDSGRLGVLGRVVQLTGQRFRPAVQPCDFDAVWPAFGIVRDPVSPTPEQGRGSDVVPSERMGESDSKLRQPLPEVALIGWSCLPRGLKDLVGVEGTTFVQQSLSFAKALVRGKNTLVGHTRNSGVSPRKGAAKRVTGAGIARATTLVAFPVGTHGVASPSGSTVGAPVSSSRTKPTSSRIFTPSCCAFSAFDPAFSPTTT
jgi:hypothetical protein